MADTSSKSGSIKRYASAAVIVGGGAALGGGFFAAQHGANQTNTGKPFNYNGQQYYVKNDSRRAVYPNKEACFKDVPLDKQSECEPKSNYGGTGAGWYGPLYSPRDTGYKPGSQYQSEIASSSNFGKRLPSSANKAGFGENGKAFTGSKGG